jgi:uncharacterized protein YjlB
MPAQLKIVRPAALLLPENGRMPNSDLPVLIYRAALRGDRLEDHLKKVFHSNHWGGTWTLGIYGFHHFHSNAHEVLGIAAGSASLQLGGEGSALIKVEKGDVIVLPAGTGHRRVKDSWDFWVVGAYPRGQEKYDEYLDKAMCGNCRLRLKAVDLPSADPLYGKDGPLTKLWHRAFASQPAPT